MLPVDLIGAAIIAGGALFGIWLAAAYSNVRLRAQHEQQAEWLDLRLAQEAQRFDDQLLMQSVQLQRQLDHDREMQDREALRRTLDEGAALITQASSALTDVDLLLEGTSTGAEERSRLIDQRIAVSEQLVEYWRRLMLRFETKDPIPNSVHTVFESFSKGSGFVFRAPESLSPQQQKEFEAALDDFNDAHSEFLLHCRRRIGIS